MLDNKVSLWRIVGYIGISFAIVISLFTMWLNQEQYKEIERNSSFEVVGNKNLKGDFARLTQIKTYTRSAERELNSAILKKNTEITAAGLSSDNKSNSDDLTKDKHVVKRNKALFREKFNIR